MNKLLLALCCSLLYAPLASAAFAVFYEDYDASAIAGAINRNDLSTTEKQVATKLWNGGFKNWATTPFALSPTCDDPNTFPVTSHRILVNASVTKQDMVDFLNSVGNRLGPGVGGYLTTLAIDVANCAVEPAV